MKTIRYISTTLIVACTLASCIHDAPGSGEATPVPNDDHTISFSIGTSANTPSTRAVDDLVGNEAAINRLDVFFYDAGGGTPIFYPDLDQIARNASRVTITIPKRTYLDELSGRSVTIWLVANSTLSREQMAGRTLDDLRAAVVENDNGRLFNISAAPPADFLMTGSIETAILPEHQELGSVTLRRAAAKIVVDISSATTPDGLFPVSAGVRLSGYLDVTLLGTESLPGNVTGNDFRLSDWHYLTPAGDVQNSFAMDITDGLYSYFNDWSSPNEDRETYITLRIDWALDPSGSGVRAYYYRIPFSYIRATNEEAAAFHRDKIRRNYVYHFVVDVTDLGSVDPEEAVDLDANFDVIDWSTGQIDTSILQFHYLFIYNSHAQVYEQPGHEWEYRSSLPAMIEIVSVECIEYSPDGTSRTVQYQPGDPQYPDQVLRRQADGRTWFGVESVIPSNYVPLVITLRATNAAGLSSDATLTILPTKYVTSTYSNGGNNQNISPLAGAYSTSTGNTGNTAQWGSNNPGGAGGDNFNFYKITTTSLDNRQILIGSTMQTILLGDPTETVSHPFADVPIYHRTAAGANHIVSPEFVIASRRGITTQLSWSQARERCTRYREAQYPAGTWRVPTFAELAMLGDMQNDPASAIKGLFVNSSGNGWWTALEAYRIRVDLYTYASGNGVNQNNTGAVRCVHDTWRD